MKYNNKTKLNTVERIKIQNATISKIKELKEEPLPRPIKELLNRVAPIMVKNEYYFEDDATIQNRLRTYRNKSNKVYKSMNNDKSKELDEGVRMITDLINEIKEEFDLGKK